MKTYGTLFGLLLISSAMVASESSTTSINESTVIPTGYSFFANKSMLFDIDVFNRMRERDLISQTQRFKDAEGVIMSLSHHPVDDHGSPYDLKAALVDLHFLNAYVNAHESTLTPTDKQKLKSLYTIGLSILDLRDNWHFSTTTLKPVQEQLATLSALDKKTLRVLARQLTLKNRKKPAKPYHSPMHTKIQSPLGGILSMIPFFIKQDGSLTGNTLLNLAIIQFFLREFPEYFSNEDITHIKEATNAAHETNIHDSLAQELGIDFTLKTDG